MTHLAFTRNLPDHASTGTGLLMRLRAWFARSATVFSIAASEPRDVIMADVARPDVVPPVLPQQDNLKTAVLLPFPIRGEALLVKLADQLRSRIANNAASRGSFDLTLSRQPHSRLTIDAAAHVEFRAGRATYHLVIELVHDTRIEVASGDFDTIVKFIAQYVADRLSEAPCDANPAEATS